MSIRRREFMAGLGVAAWSLAARAQQAEPVRRVGALIGGPGASEIAVFRERLAISRSLAATSSLRLSIMAATNSCIRHRLDRLSRGGPVRGRLRA